MHCNGMETQSMSDGDLLAEARAANREEPVKRFGDCRAVKVLLVGDSGTGKSSIIKRYFDRTFSPSFISTIG